ncbi:hypothetical protein MUP65_01055 [Patescibacteria group bacterium]|nr:hypothetical protein [Patescibacteria group bacterium]
MTKLLRKIAIFTSFFFLFATFVMAADFSLTSIGNYDTSDGVPSQIWYTGTQPTFSGTGESGATVNIMIGSSQYATTVAATEQWSWIPPQPLTETDHLVNLVSGSGSVSFTLTIGTATTTPTPTEATTAATTTPTATATPTTVEATTTLPESGGLMPTLLVTALAFGMIGLPAVRRWAFTDK